MNKSEIEEVLSIAIKKKLIGTKYDNKEIIDTKVQINNIDWGGGTRHEIFIEVLVSSPKGRTKTWLNYPIY